MPESDSPDLEKSVTARLSQARGQIGRSLEQVSHGNPLGAETEPTRAVARLQAKASLGRTEATLIANAIKTAAEEIARPGAAAFERKETGPEALLGQTLDFVSVSFFTRGTRCSSASS